MLFETGFRSLKQRAERDYTVLMDRIRIETIVSNNPYRTGVMNSEIVENRNNSKGIYDITVILIVIEISNPVSLNTDIRVVEIGTIKNNRELGTDASEMVTEIGDPV